MERTYIHLSVTKGQMPPARVCQWMTQLIAKKGISHKMWEGVREMMWSRHAGREGRSKETV